MMLRCSRRPHLSDVFNPHVMPLPTITPPKSTWRRAISTTKIQHRYHPRNSTKRSGQITILLPKNLNVSGILGGFPDPKPPFGNIDPKKWVPLENESPASTIGHFKSVSLCWFSGGSVRRPFLPPKQTDTIAVKGTHGSRWRASAPKHSIYPHEQRLVGSRTKRQNVNKNRVHTLHVWKQRGNGSTGPLVHRVGAPRKKTKKVVECCRYMWATEQKTLTFHYP